MRALPNKPSLEKIAPVSSRRAPNRTCRNGYCFMCLLSTRFIFFGRSKSGSYPLVQFSRLSPQNFMAVKKNVTSTPSSVSTGGQRPTCISHYSKRFAPGRATNGPTDWRFFMSSLRHLTMAAACPSLALFLGCGDDDDNAEKPERPAWAAKPAWPVRPAWAAS